MKPERLKLILTTLFCIYGISIPAQTIHKPGQYKIDDHVYVVSKYGYQERLSVKENSGLISSVENTKNSQTGIEFPRFSSKETITSSFITVLGIARIKELIPEKYVMILLYYDTNGKVQAVKYIINKNSKLTLKEINALTTYIKKNVSFEIPPHIEKNGKITILNQLIRFDRLVD